MSITTEQIQGLTGKVFGQGSDKVGSIGEVYLDDTSGAPSWVTVKTGLFGTSETFVPLEGARAEGDDLYVAYSEDKIKNAPRIDPDGSLSPAEEDRLYEYYELSGTGSADVTTDATQTGYVDDTTADAAPTGHVDTITTTDTSATDTSATDTTTGAVPGSADRADQTVGHDTSGPTTDDAMTVSEERLTVGTAARESGRARLRKYVTTETVTETVPVQHEEVVLEREPITADNYDASQTGPAISEEEHEVVLHEEVPVVEKNVEAVERVRLGTETVSEEATVSEEVRKENVELVDPDDASPRR